MSRRGSGAQPWREAATPTERRLIDSLDERLADLDRFRLELSGERSETINRVRNRYAYCRKKAVRADQVSSDARSKEWTSKRSGLFRSELSTSI